MKHKKSLGAAAAVAALIGVATALPAMTDDADRLDVEVVLPMLALSRTAADSVPKAVDLDNLGGIDEATVRSLGSDGTARYWVARAGRSGVCLIAHIPGGNEISASTCGTISDFNRRGLAIIAGQSRSDLNTSVEAYLLPSDVDVTAIASSSMLRKSSDNPAHPALLTVNPQDPRLQAAEVPREHGDPFQFRPIQLTGQ